MATYFSATAIKERFDSSIQSKHPLVLADVGIGITAKFSEAGGADMICVDLTGMFRVDAVSSIASIMPYANANEVVLERAQKVMPRVKNLPVCVGISASDPTIEPSLLFSRLKEMGVSAVANSPSIGYYINRERNDFEDAGMGVAREAEVLKQAKAQGFFTIGYAYDEAGAKLLGDAGVDVLVCDFRVTEGGSIGIGSAYTVEQAIDFTQKLTAAARATEQNMYVLVHGGPVSSAEVTKVFYEQTAAVGVVAGSLIERLPVEQAIADATRSFKSTTIRSRG